MARRNQYSFIGLPALIVMTLANLPCFHFIVLFHPGTWVTSFFPWFSVVHHARLLNQPRANYPSDFAVHDQLPAFLTDTHK